MADNAHVQRIIVRDEKHGLPYSKGLMARSIMASGLSPSTAYEVAQLIEHSLYERSVDSITASELQELATNILRDHVGQEYADSFRRWQALGRLDKPLVVLIGGTTGVGKSTVATEVAHRLGITRIVSTDALREVMRTVISPELMPSLHTSSFAAWQVLRAPAPEDEDPAITGFREQTAAISVGVRAVIVRSIREGLNVVVEGIHVVPGFLELSDFYSDAFIVPIVITVENQDDHRSHFSVREFETEGSRPFARYLANFDYIRKIGRYIERLARARTIPVISSYGLDLTVDHVLEVVMGEVLSDEEFLQETKDAGL